MKTLNRRAMLKIMSAIVPCTFVQGRASAQAVISFTVWNESSYQKTFTFIDEANNGQAVYNMAPDEKKPLSLAVKDGNGHGWMRYKSNYQPGWTQVGWIKSGDVVTLY